MALFTQRPQWLILALALGVCISSAANATGVEKPLAIPASQFWDGDDGPWSTFRIAVGGDAAQQMRVLPASGQSTTLLVLPEACNYATSKTQDDCSEQRGGLYMRDTSRTWSEFGQYKLDTYLESRIGLEGDGLFGFEDISLGWIGDGMPALANQSIAGTISPLFPIGSLALSQRPINFTDYNNPIPSLLHNLRNMATPIPSLSWSYTAGGYNLAPKVFGSLVLGGYDSTRFEPNNLTFTFGADISLDLQVAIQRIELDGRKDALMSKPIISYVSTLVPDIWLPMDACKEFSRVFRLSYNTTSNNYYVNNTMHQLNLADNPVVNFQVGPEMSGSSVVISLPYWNFHLTVQEANLKFGTSTSAFRFPIRQASNDTQYVLGRAFLQSAYLSVDYERSSFNLSQARYPSSSTKENIVPILAQHLSPNPSIVTLSVGAVAGAAVGGSALLLIGLILLVYLYRRRHITRLMKAKDIDETELQSIVAHEMAADEKKYELQNGTGLKHELVGDTDPKVELSACAEQEKPAEAAATHFEVFELPADEKNVFEMEGDGRFDDVG